MEKAPATWCPTCFAPLTVVDNGCWACGRTFSGRELWDFYEANCDC